MSVNSHQDVEKMPEQLNTESEARRNFLLKAGKFASITPPAITLLLGTSLSSRAIAKSCGSRPKQKAHSGKGWGDKKHAHSGPRGQVKKLASLDLGKHKK
ncbi:hypothetical protein PWG15_23935 (plasmid) [Ensifer adhaerens]|uniref:hypothetical protein n=1 Tax=Ensifer adhaerens TaxID=106592 RepID=UPI0023A9953C|nr:hypothetical protein [Ensifer adhaerens]WDZ80814.1 hypothetical protein PWG15_23935 [Ensifer adhaerens]